MSDSSFDERRAALIAFKIAAGLTEAAATTATDSQLAEDARCPLHERIINQATALIEAANQRTKETRLYVENAGRQLAVMFTEWPADLPLPTLPELLNNEQQMEDFMTMHRQSIAGRDETIESLRQQLKEEEAANAKFTDQRNNDLLVKANEIHALKEQLEAKEAELKVRKDEIATLQEAAKAQASGGKKK